MDIVSLNFILFTGIALMLYYAVSENRKPWVLTAVGFFFVATYDYRGIFYMLFLSWLTWAAALAIERSDTGSQKKKRLCTAAIASAIGLLLGIKYLLPAAFSGSARLAVRIFVPLGISYYTLQAISYVMDVYWGRISAEKKFSRILLFLTYFPQVLQGPISRYGDLSKELYGKDHCFCLHNLKSGVQLMLWGFFKLLVVADKCSVFSAHAFHMSKTAYGGAALLALIMFGFELYGNFSGGIDVIRGLSECFGISLKDNFAQPFFARSLGDFWRRWHITLGSWMKDYVFFPLSMSRPFSSLKKKLKKRIPKKTANRVIIALADVIVFLLVGLWHGLDSNFALWGLYNGLILAFSELMTEQYLKARAALRIRESSGLWQGFCRVRTFLIVTMGWCTDCAMTASGSLGIFFNVLQFGRTNMDIFNISTMNFMRAMAAVVILLFVEGLHERKISIRKWADSRSTAFQMVFWALVIQMIVCLGNSSATGGLMYAGY